MQNALTSISFRFAAKLEHPDGIPLASSYGDFGTVINGMLRLTFDPPIAHKHSISVGVFGNLSGTRDSFAGILETGFAGDVFAPEKSLISSVKTMIENMSREMGVHDRAKETVVLEEILIAITIHVPVRQIYDRVRADFPVEYRAMNLDYKRRNGISIEEDMFALVSKQQRQMFHFSSFKVRKAFVQQNEVVRLDKKRLEKLYKSDAKTYDELMKRLEGVEPVNGAYVVFQDEKNQQVFLIGRGKQGNYVRTKESVPTLYLQSVSDEEDEEFSPEERRDFGLEQPQQQTQQQATPAQPQESEADKENKVFAKTIIAWAKKYSERDAQEVSKQFKNPKGIVKKVKLDANGIPSSVYNNKQSAMQHKDKILELYDGLFNRKFIIADPFFLALHEYLTQK